MRAHFFSVCGVTAYFTLWVGAPLFFVTLFSHRPAVQQILCLRAVCRRLNVIIEIHNRAHDAIARCCLSWRKLRARPPNHLPVGSGVSRPIPTVAQRVTSPVRVTYENEPVSASLLATSIWFNKNNNLINKTCRNCVAKLVKLNWDTSLTGVGRDARGLEHKHIRIRGIRHIQNKMLRRNYVLAYLDSLSRYGLPQELKDSPIATDSMRPAIYEDLETTNKPSCDETSLALDRLHLLEGEAFLFHGTDKIAIHGIVQEGFNLRYCKGGAFGHPGIYLSEHAQKADQYTDKTGRRSTDLYMLVVRVALGRTEMYEKKKSGEDYDTIIGGRNNLFREFVKTYTAQLYPEFVVNYDRLN